MTGRGDVGLPLLSTVALLDDGPGLELRRGQVCTVVEELGPGMAEVELSDDEGRTYAMVPLPTSSLLRLHHEPREAA